VDQGQAAEWSTVAPNYFSVAKARRELDYKPLFATDKAMQDCLPYRLELFEMVQAAGLDPAKV
jgi:3beta-hydroxy-Delta5-steroid dehydrogenase / steroid Delta-isomerase